MLTDELIYWPEKRAVKLRNVTCPYCGIAITAANMTEEHVIGRKFMPKRSLENVWNLILSACKPCNNRKASLEDDISAISMQPDVRGKHFSAHPQLAVDAAHKGQRAHSRSSGKPVADSKTSMQIKFQLAPGLLLTFNMIGQPTVEDARIFELALRHFQGFFYLITYRETEKRGMFWRGRYAAIQALSRNDWGNEVARAFMQQTAAWKTYLLAITAQDHFKIAIRKHPSHEMWSLAVEWNQNYRILAAAGTEEAVEAFVAGLPKLKADGLSELPENFLRVRAERGLNEDEDTLFQTDDKPLCPEAGSPAD
jgi:hypothetical protein